MAMSKAAITGLVILAGAGAAALYFATRKKTIYYQPQSQDTPKPWTFQIPLAMDRSYVTAAPAQTPKQAVAAAQISARTPAANVLETNWLANAFKEFSGPATTSDDDSVINLSCKPGMACWNGPVTQTPTAQTPTSPPANNYVMADRRNAPAQPTEYVSSGFMQSIADSFKPSAPISLLRPADPRSPAYVAVSQKSPGILDFIFGDSTGAKPTQSFIRPQTTPTMQRPTFAIQSSRPPVDGSFADSPLQFLESAVKAISEPIRQIVEPEYRAQPNRVSYAAPTKVSPMVRSGCSGPYCPPTSSPKTIVQTVLEPIRKIVEPIESAPSTSVGGQIVPTPISAQERQYGFTGAYTVHGERFLNYKDNGATMSIKASYWENSQDRRGCKWTPNGFVCPSDGAKYDMLLNANALKTKDAPSVYEAFK